MTIQLNNPVYISNATGTHTHKLCKQVVCLDTGEVFASCTDAAEAVGVNKITMSACCTGRLRTCKGKHYAYVSRVSENFDALTSRLRSVSAEQAANEAELAEFRAWKAEQETKRKAEEERQQALEKAEAKLERRRRVLANAESRAEIARQRVREAMEEVYALDAKYNVKE